MSEQVGARVALPAVAQAALLRYRTAFGVAASEPLAVAWAPGRINIIGEHTDYNEGYVLPAAVDRLVALAGRAEAEPFATLYSAHHQTLARAPLGDHAGADAASDGAQARWTRYPQAVWRQLTQAGAAPALGFSAAIVGDVPLGGGLSSSAALEVATAMFARALGGASLPPMSVATLCQQAEQAGAGVRVGVMDQAASCLGQPQHALLLDCRSLTWRAIPASLPQTAWVVFDTGVAHELAASEYNVRRGECEAAVAQLAPALAREAKGRTIQALRDVSATDLARHAALLDATLLRRARHVVSENARTLSAAEALAAGDGEALGALMNASHASLRDDYAVSCVELDAAVEIAQATPGTLGARMMGAGFGGSILALVRSEALDALSARLAEKYPARTGRQGAVVVCSITGQTGFRTPLQLA